jgi:hypothetical protein
MQTTIAFLFLAYVLLALFWAFAARRVAAGHRRFVPHLIGPLPLLGVALVLMAGILVGRQPLLAAAMGVFSLVYLGVVLWVSMQMYRAVETPAPGENRLQAMAAPPLSTIWRPLPVWC